MTLSVAVTGVDGFLGWHLACRVLSRSDIELVGLGRAAINDPAVLTQRLKTVDAVIHLAGANRGSDDEVSATNSGSLNALRPPSDRPLRCKRWCSQFRFSPRGTRPTEGQRGRHTASWWNSPGTLRSWTCYCRTSSGEQGRPDYNSFVATFAQRIAVGERPDIREDRAVNLMHAQDAASALLDGAATGKAQTIQPSGHATSVGKSSVGASGTGGPVQRRSISPTSHRYSKLLPVQPTSVLCPTVQCSLPSLDSLR